MALLTTSKLIAVFDSFASDARGGLHKLFDDVQASEAASHAYDKSLETPGYQKVREEMFSSLDSAPKRKGGVQAQESESLVAGRMGLQPNQQYYLIKGFRSRLSETDFHIRFENPGEGEIQDFHLTTEEGWTAVNFGGGMWAKGRFFFKIENGVIIPQIKNKIKGKGDDQLSDMRLAPLVLDTMIYVYQLMYCQRSI